MGTAKTGKVEAFTPREQPFGPSPFVSFRDFSGFVPFIHKIGAERH